MAVVSAIRQALKDALVAKIGEADQQVSAYVLKNPTLPVVWVRPRPDTPITFHQAMGNGLESRMFLIEAICGSGTDIGAQQLIDAYISNGDKSIFEAIEHDVTLGGVVQNVVVRTCDSYIEFVEASGNAATGANWLVEVYP